MTDNITLTLTYATDVLTTDDSVTLNLPSGKYVNQTGTTLAITSGSNTYAYVYTYDADSQRYIYSDGATATDDPFRKYQFDIEHWYNYIIIYNEDQISQQLTTVYYSLPHDTHITVYPDAFEDGTILNFSEAAVTIQETSITKLTIKNKSTLPSSEIEIELDNVTLNFGKSGQDTSNSRDDYYYITPGDHGFTSGNITVNRKDNNVQISLSQSNLTVGGTMLGTEIKEINHDDKIVTIKFKNEAASDMSFESASSGNGSYHIVLNDYSSPYLYYDGTNYSYYVNASTAFTAVDGSTITPEPGAPQQEEQGNAEEQFTDAADELNKLHFDDTNGFVWKDGDGNNLPGDTTTFKTQLFNMKGVRFTGKAWDEIKKLIAQNPAGAAQNTSQNEQTPEVPNFDDVLGEDDFSTT